MYNSLEKISLLQNKSKTFLPILKKPS